MTKPYTEEELKHILFAAPEFPLEFPDDIGIGIQIGNCHTELRIHHPDNTRHVVLLVDSFALNKSLRATHFYGWLHIDGVILRPNEGETEMHTDCNVSDKQPMLDSEYVFMLERPLSAEEIDEKDQWGQSRWGERKVGDYVIPFKSKQQLIDCAKKVFKQCFKGKWSLWLEDKTGYGITRSLLTPDKLDILSFPELGNMN